VAKSADMNDAVALLSIKAVAGMSEMVMGSKSYWGLKEGKGGMAAWSVLRERRKSHNSATLQESWLEYILVWRSTRQPNPSKASMRKPLALDTCMMLAHLFNPMSLEHPDRHCVHSELVTTYTWSKQPLKRFHATVDCDTYWAMASRNE
jgi:hypothetical protein